jgi:hypothetical protein
MNSVTSVAGTVITTTAVELVSAGASDGYGVAQNGLANGLALADCDHPTDWDVVMTLEAVAQ